MTNQNGNSITKELFRYANVKAPIILDLEARLKTFPAGRSLLEKSGKEKFAVAKEIHASDTYIDSEEKLSFDYFDQLSIDAVPKNRLPCKSCIVDKVNFQAKISKNSQKIKEDINKVSQSLFAAISLRNSSEIQRLSKLLQFIESYPSLHQTDKRIQYAPVITKRFSPKIQDRKSEGNNARNRSQNIEDNQTELSSKQVLTLWNAANNFKKEKERQISIAIDEVNKRTFVPEITTTQSIAQTKVQATAKASEATDPIKKKNAQQFETFSKQKRNDLLVLNKQKDAIKSQNGIEIVLSMIKNEDFLESDRELKQIVRYLNASSGTLERMTEKHADFFDWYRESKEKESKSTSLKQNCDLDINDPCMRKFASDRHLIDGKDQVKSLGEADLIVVEENWMKYTPGEISAIETVLKNEKRVKIVNTESIFEETVEFTTEEISEKESELESKTSNELSSQIESELKTRFESDINSSVKGSGGGSIGVVNFNGEGSLGTKVGIGMDSSFKNTDSSNFSNEIISKALEKTKKTTTEKRSSRTFKKYETNLTNEIDNTGSNSNHINGIYCFLDKHICITERQYGIRQFLIADVEYPGRELIFKEMQRQVLNLNELGLPPVFDLGPGDIDEHNYLSLVGRFRASNISTPPPIIKMVSKTYKTDASNENREQNGNKFKNVVDVLVPFFGQYKRFLMQDNIEIPEGYRVQEVYVTVTHGSNGVSIPAHLPFTLGGAMLYAIPKLMISAIPTYALFYLPIALSEIVYLASPVLHYNADSSNCTINIGHETQESSYFFFQPDELLLKISNLVSGFPQLSENVVAQIGTHLTKFLEDMPDMIDAQLINGLQGPFNTAVDKLKEFVEIIRIMAKPLYGQAHIPEDIVKISDFFTTNLQDFINSIKDANINVNNLFEPLKELIDAIKGIIETELLQSFFDELENLFSIFENSDHKIFTDLKGHSNTLPVSFNCIALKPGITINLTASMVRVEDQSLDAWRMETFDRLNQAYYQLEADYESKLLMKNQNVPRFSPGLMRNEEERVIKDRVIRSLDNLHSASSANGVLSMDHYKLFEHAIDWENISYRLYNYGPKASELVYEKLGLYKGADERRKSFMNALWAQVLIPLKADELLESYMMGYIQTGEVKTLDELMDMDAQPDGEIDEIAAIYRDIILRRQQLTEEPIETHRPEVIPTDLMIIYEGSEGLDFPVNEIALNNCNGS